MKYFWSLIFICIISISNGQTSGYLGKCNTFSVKTETSISGLFYEVNGTFSIPDGFFKYQLDYTRTVSENGAIGFSLGLINNVIYKNNTVYNDIYLPSNVYGLTYTLSYSIFSFKNRGAIAPLGSYWKPSLFYSSADIIDVNNFSLGQSNIVGIGIAYGKNYILFDQLLLNYEIQSNIPIVNDLFSSLASPVLVSNDDFTVNFLKFNVGIGYVFNDRFNIKRK